MKNIGLILKNASENKGYTQKQVMAMTGINSKSLSGYENNVAEPDLFTFAKLIQLYDLSADDVLEIKNSGIDISKLQKELQMISLFRTLDTSHQEDILIILDAFNKKNAIKKPRYQSPRFFITFSVFYL